VIVGGDLRFYGRGARGNRILTEGEVARLYERRQEWRVSADAVLAEVVASSDIPPAEGVGYLHAFTRPVPPETEMLDHALTRLGSKADAHLALIVAARNTKLQGTYSPSLEQAQQWDRFGPDAWRLSSYPESERLDPKYISRMTEVLIGLDGTGRLFCGRATDFHRTEPNRPPAIMEGVIAANVEAFLAVMATIYTAAGFLGPVDVGVAITNIKGADSYISSQDFLGGEYVYPSDAFTRTLRAASASELQQPHEVAHRLLGRFYEATSGSEGLNLFETDAS
jgi:hypothetical protein